MNNKFKIALLLIVFGAIFRIIPHPANFTPVAAMALIGGMYFKNRILMIATPLIGLYLTDFILNNFIMKSFITQDSGFIFWSNFMTFTYVAILCTVGLGFYLKTKGTLHKIIGGGLLSSFLFYVVTNFGTWLTSGLYPKNFMGMIECYTLAIPFYGSTLISNLLFTALFVLTIENAYKLLPKTKLA